MKRFHLSVMYLTCFLYFFPLTCHAVPLMYELNGRFDLSAVPVSRPFDGLPYTLGFTYETVLDPYQQQGQWVLRLPGELVRGPLDLRSDLTRVDLLGTGPNLSFEAVLFFIDVALFDRPLPIFNFTSGLVSVFPTGASPLAAVGEDHFIEGQFPSLAPIPEPSTLVLLGSIGLWFGLRRWHAA